VSNPQDEPRRHPDPPRRPALLETPVVDDACSGMIHTGGMKIMAVDRHTVSLPKDLSKEIEKIAKREKLSFSAALATLAEEAIRKRKSLEGFFVSLGAGESGLPDLGTNHDKYIDEIFRKGDF
jgi:hypothetical protein